MCDMIGHKYTLARYASECDHVTEFGVRRGISTGYLLDGNPTTMVSYDTDPFDGF